jgi:hypothetical protein
MRRRVDAYLEPLVEPERFAFYQAVCAFAENEIAPELLTWERQHCLLPEKAFKPSQIWASSVSRSQRSPLETASACSC